MGHNLTPELIWMIGGWIVGLVLLELLLPREGIVRKGTPESRAYLWTINIIRLHIGAGIVLGCVQYSRWYANRGPMDHVWDWWPTGLVYIACILFDVLLIHLFFQPAYRKYRQPADRLVK